MTEQITIESVIDDLENAITYLDNKNKIHDKDAFMLMNMVAQLKMLLENKE